jgi:dTDP-4-amino-4,6-dideoxygalactose transaminase
VVKDADRAALAPGLRHHGMRGFEGERQRYWLPAMSNVDFDIDGVWPVKACLGEPQCAAGTMLLKRVDAVNERRRARARHMIEALAGYDEIAFQATPDDCENVYYCLPARYDGPGNGRGRDDFMARMAFHHRVRMAVQYYPLYRYPIFQKAGFGDAACPETDRFFDAMVSFPPQEWMPDDQFDYMVAAARETLDFLRG